MSTIQKIFIIFLIFTFVVSCLYITMYWERTSKYEDKRKYGKQYFLSKFTYKKGKHVITI